MPGKRLKKNRIKKREEGDGIIDELKHKVTHPFETIGEIGHLIPDKRVEAAAVIFDIAHWLTGREENDFDKRPFLMQDVFKEKFPTLYIFAKKKSGKTYFAIQLMLKLIEDDYSKLFIFSQSIMNDDTIGPFIKYLNDRDIYYEGYQELNEGKEDYLKKVLEFLKEEKLQKKELEREYIEQNKLTDEEKEELKDNDEYVHKKDFQNPGQYKCYNVVYFDDLTQEDLRNKTLENLMRTSRHYDLFLILCSQSYKNLYSSQFREEISHLIVFKNESDETLKNILEEFGLNYDFNLFKKIYLDATKEEFNFLFIDINSGVLYKNLTEEYVFL